MAAALVFLGGPLLLLNPPQCLFHCTQEQVDASSCIIGANIGMPLFLFAGLIAWLAITITLAGVAVRSSRRGR
jgi:hypothetical protein